MSDVRDVGWLVLGAIAVLISVGVVKVTGKWLGKNVARSLKEYQEQTLSPVITRTVTHAVSGARDELRDHFQRELGGVKRGLVELDRRITDLDTRNDAAHAKVAEELGVLTKGQSRLAAEVADLRKENGT